MIALLDTNLVIRLADVVSPGQSLVADRLARYVADGLLPVIAPQIVYESWTVLTRPKELNGFGLVPSIASTTIRGWISRYDCPDDPPGLAIHLLQLCESHQVRGKQGYDCRLVAWMELHGIKHLLTLNSADFARYPQVEVLDLSL